MTRQNPLQAYCAAYRLLKESATVRVTEEQPFFTVDAATTGERAADDLKTAARYAEHGTPYDGSMDTSLLPDHIDIGSFTLEGQLSMDEDGTPAEDQYIAEFQALEETWDASTYRLTGSLDQTSYDSVDAALAVAADDVYPALTDTSRTFSDILRKYL